MWPAERPGFGAQRTLDKVSQREEEQQNKYPGNFPGDYGDVVISLVYEPLAAGDRGAVFPLRAADLLVPTDVMSTFLDGIHSCADDKGNSKHRKRLAPGEKHFHCVQRRETIQ